MMANSMCPAVWVAPPVAFLVHCGFCFIDGLTQQLALEGFNFPLQLADGLLHCCHGGVLGGHIISVFCHLGHQFNVGARKVTHCSPVLSCCLCKVFEIFLYSNQVVGYVSALAQGLLPLSEVLLRLNEVCLKGRSGFVVLSPPRPTVFRVLDHICYESVGDTDKLCFRDWLARCHCDVGVLIEPLNEAFEGFLRVVW